MNLGILFLGIGSTLSQQITVAQQAERSGFTSLHMAEAYRSAWVPLTAMAAATSTVRLGPYILNAYGHSPMMSGMAAVDFNEMSGGRLLLGVGGGNRVINEQWQGVPHERALTKLREYVTLLKMIARTRLGDRLTYEGKVHSMDWAPHADPGDQPFPVYLAAVFPAMTRVAAQVADGIAAGGTLSAEYLRDVVKPQAAEAAAAVDRDPATLGWKAVSIIAVDDDRERARRTAREAICSLYAPLPHPYYEFTMREQGFGEAADALLKLMPAGELEASVDAIPDACIDRLAIAGTLDECRERLTSYEGVVDELLLLNVTPAINGDVVGSYAPLMQLAKTT
ncbi:MAG: LLM class flavin-dependent oxidoreductase [Rhodospirillales bacterium]|nr:LLM class flavin-dependent oxidoreductase [Rhodospirillales bacterium]